MEMMHLRYFVAVAEELNYSAAARRLHMATSPLSQRIKDLERDLGYQLFDCSTHHVTLTPAGVALLPMAREVLAPLADLPVLEVICASHIRADLTLAPVKPVFDYLREGAR
jgi:DNA-binding transcriptional LysR family regulator